MKGILYENHVFFLGGGGGFGFFSSFHSDKFYLGGFGNLII